MKLETEKIKDWFYDKYDWHIYKEVEKEMYTRHFKEYPLWRRLLFIWFGIPEKDRLWLIQETVKRYIQEQEGKKPFECDIYECPEELKGQLKLGDFYG